MFELTFWQASAITFLYYHIAGTAYTIYVHRGLMHRTVSYHPWLAKFFQTSVWMTIGAWNRTILGFHLVHHKYADHPIFDQPSPNAIGKWEVLFVKPIRAFFKHILFKRVIPIVPDKYIVDQSKLTDTQIFLVNEADRLIHQEKLDYEWYIKHSRIGPAIFLITNLILFGWVGLIITAIVQFSVVVTLITVSDGILHLYGYRNFDTRDNSRNFLPWGIIFSGEELHNNHHGRPGSANFAQKPWEFDIGYFYICIFRLFGLAKTK